MRNRPLLLSVLGLRVVGAGLVMVRDKSGSPISGESCERIQPGMTEAEVEAILGGPAGDYTLGRPPSAGGLGRGKDAWEEGEARAGMDGTIVVRFEPGGQILSAQFDEPIRNERPLLDRLRQRLGL